MDLSEKRMCIETARLLLRPFEEWDRELVYPILTNPVIRETYMLPPCESRIDLDALFDRLSCAGHDPDHFVYGIFRKGRPVGFVNDCGGAAGEVEVGYVIHPSDRGRGFAPEALRAVIDELFRLGFSQVTAGYFSENHASLRVMEKCGMRAIGREEDIEYRGRVHRCLYCAIDRAGE